MQGKLPWGLPAGKYRGGIRRRISPRTRGYVRYPRDQRDQLRIRLAILRPYSGQYSVEEAFLETDVPILKNDIVQEFSLNAAGRITDYSTSGVVETWKLGFTNQIDDNIRLRGTWSLDIRAPMISELFSPGQIGVGGVQYPIGGPTYQTNTAAGGNPNLQPEKAVTTSFGFVLTPEFIEGLSISLDWYSINIHGGIYKTGAYSDRQSLPAGGVSSLLAAFLLFLPNQAGGCCAAFPGRRRCRQCSSPSRHLALDLQANYAMGLFDGTLSWALRGNYTSEHDADRDWRDIR